MESGAIDVDAELKRQLKKVGEQLLKPSDSIDELLAVLDKVEKLLSKVDQSPTKSMLEALKPSMQALIEESLLKHSDDDVKVSVASCISEITRITAPDAPYDDDQMRDVFQLIVSSFEDLADQSSRSYNKRASILETVSKVRSCVIMLDLECDGLIVEMFEHFLKSVRDYHFESIYPSMETIMVLVLEESEEITAEMLKPLLASVKKDSKGVLPVARKLGEGVLLKSADKLKPCLMQILTSLGESLDMYTKVVAAVCEGTTATFENNDENASGLQLAKENKVEKESVDGANQADESIATASSDQTEQVIKEEDCNKEVDPTSDKSPKSVMSNGVNVVAKEEASVDQESSKKTDSDVNEKHLNKEDTDDSDAADKLAKAKSQTELTSKKRGKKTDSVINSAEPSDSSHVEGEKEIEKDNDVKVSENEEDNEVKESENEEDNEVKRSDNEEDNEVKGSDNEEDNEVKDSDNEEDKEVKELESEEDNEVKESDNEDNDAKESENEEDNDVKESDNEEDDVVKESEIEKDSNVAQVSSPKAKEGKPVTANVSSPSKSGTPPDETRVKKGAQPKSKSSTQDDASEETGDLDLKPLKRVGKKAVVAKEVKPSPKDESEDDSEASSDSDGKPAKKSRSKLTKQPGKKMSLGDSEAKKPKHSVAKKSKQSVKKVEKEEESDSDAKPLKQSDKKGEKSKTTVDEEEESDSENKPLKLSVTKNNSKKKDDVKRGNKTVTKKNQAKSLSSNDEMEMDSSPKTATKSAKGEGNSKETSATSAKRKRTTGKEKVSDTIKYDESLIGTKVKVWWPEDKMYYEGVVETFYSSKKKHKVTYVDGEIEVLNLKTQKWEILDEFSVRDEEATTEAQSEEASPQIHKKKRTKTVSTSQEKSKDSAKKLAGVSSSKSKVPASKDNKSKEHSKETGKSKEDVETPKSKTASKSKGKTPQSGGKTNTNGPTKGKSGSSNVKEPEAVKTSESTKGGSKSGKKRKKRT